jgi:two-component system, sensor histidine kinase PdtaS
VVTVIGPADRDGTPYVTVEVRDDGVGLPAGFSLEGATGLGLSIVRTLVEHELEGEIAFAARADGVTGTVVTVTCPLVREDR